MPDPKPLDVTERYSAAASVGFASLRAVLACRCRPSRPEPETP